MKINLNPRLPFLLSTCTALLLFQTRCAEGDHNDLQPDCTQTHWEYEGLDGPDHWSELCPGFLACSGQVQSPVNITGAVDDATLAPIAPVYTASKTQIVNNGHTLQFTYDAGSTITVDGETYTLLQFHSHTPSEHTVNGQSYPLEIHFVHKNDATGKLAVIGLLFEEGAENAHLQPFIANLPDTKDEQFVSATTTFNAADWFPGDKSYFTYSGSLTTPPCSEIVTWIVLEEPVEASTAQIHAFEAIEHENNRPIQPLYGRVIKHSN